MLIVDMERVFHLDEMGDLGFALLTGDPQRCQIRQCACNGLGAVGRPYRGAVAVPVGGFALARRQGDVFGFLQPQQQVPARHVLELAIGRSPVPQLTELDRKSTTPPSGIVRQQLLDQADIGTESPALYRDHDLFHGPYDTANPSMKSALGT